MNSKITLTLLMVTCLAFSMSAQVIWGGPGDPNGEFDGGLNDWTTEGLYSNDPDSAANAIWIWSADATPQGSLSGTTPIASESVANGAVIFDSDFLDNGGNLAVNDDGSVTDFGMTGTGAAPAFDSGTLTGTGQGGTLTSPTIDCSAEESVNLRFFSYFRSFRGEMFVDVSGDNGGTWSSIAVNTNDDLDVTPSNVVNMNITEFAAGKAEVKIRFRWENAYYYWMIDDVSLVALPGNNLAISNTQTSPFYTPHSAVAPACAFAVDTFSFTTGISNLGSDTIANMIYKVNISINDTDEIIHTDSIVIVDFLPGITDSTFSLPNTWVPEGLEEVAYRIDHTVYNMDDLADFDPADNTVSQFFIVSESTFAKEYSADGNIGTWNDGGFYAIGAFYQFGPDCMENYTVSSIDYSVGQVGGDDEPLVGRPVEFWLWKLTMPLDSFDSTTNYEDDILTLDHPSMEFVAFSQDAIDEDDAAADLISSDEVFLDNEAEEVSPIFEAGETYALFAHWGTQGSTSPLHIFATDVNTSTDLFYSGGWFGGFSTSKSAPILRLQLQLFSSVDDIVLSDDAVKVYPNPATSLLNIELNLEKSSDATVTIADITGKVLSYQNLNNITRDVVTLDVSTYVAGTYLARVATSEGTKTIKFIVD